MNLSQRGIDFIKRREGFRKEVYDDGYGFLTIGYGHLVRTIESFPDGISEEEGEELLRKDTQWAEEAVSKAVKVPLTQPQFDALVSLAYNIGGARFISSHLVELLNMGLYEAVPIEILKWKKSGGKVSQVLKNRRAMEVKIWERGIYE